MRSITLRFGLIMSSGFIFYFLAMHLLDLSQFPGYRLYNAVIQLACIVMAVLAYKNARPNEFGKLTAVSLGVVTSVVGVLSFAIFQFLFLVLSPDFVTELKQAVTPLSGSNEPNLSFFSGPIGSNSELSNSLASFLTPFTAAVIVAIEGMVAGLVLSYLIMRLLFMRK
ncbi:MAG: DUF4199 family protein [Saprospiraceae bacterium]|nr:DUF4199 family protein [Saprospiraceae bacterium]